MLSKPPFFLKASLSLIGLMLTGLLIYIGQDILVPIAFSILLAILLLPLNNWMEKKKVPRVVAISISLVLSLTFIGGVIWFLSMQIAGFADDLPAIKKQVTMHYYTVIHWLHDKFHLSYTKQMEYISNATETIKSKGGGMIQSTLLSVTDALLLLVLIPIYTFLILYYRPMIRKFFMDVFDQKHSEHVKHVLNHSKLVVQNYMVGLLIEMGIVAALNTVGFMIVGIQYAIFLAVLTAVLNMVPYVGMLIANVFCILVTLTTSQNFGDIFGVVVVMIVVQFIDNNFLMPRIVGSKVKINSLITIIGVLIGGALCGVSGMFIAIPSIAILKTIFDRVDELKPWGMLLGDEITTYEPSVIYRRLTTWKQKPNSIVPQKVEIPANISPSSTVAATPTETGAQS